MSLKKLFGDKSQNGIVPRSTSDSHGDVESLDYVEAVIESSKRLIPDVDFSNPQNFAKFGSAKRYYLDSIKRIHDTYPYDGSGAEKQRWHNSSSYLDEYIFENEYPRTNGYAVLGSEYGSDSGVGGVWNFILNDTNEYIRVFGGPNVDNILDESKNRKSNLEFIPNRGMTIEFWLKKDGFGSEAHREIIFDARNSEDYFSPEFGRFMIALYSESPNEIEVSLWSGSGLYAFCDMVTTTDVVGTGWNHFAITCVLSGSNVNFELYQNGQRTHFESVSGGGAFNSPINFTEAHIGSLVFSHPEDLLGETMKGHGKLSGSLDEFRFWKTKRTSKEIGRNWFTQVNGGTNTDEANVDLGIYFKFNEGIYGSSDIDSIVVDYSGRNSNGSWVGYSENNSRSTSSAIIESGVAEYEYLDPIMYSNHPDVALLRSNLEKKGVEYDIRNNASIFNSIPEWIIQEDENSDQQLVHLTQMIASYFDSLYLQIEFLPKIKQHHYFANGSLPNGSMNRILESYGLNSPDLFIDSTILESILSRDENKLFDDNLNDIKNIIYRNVYNNLINIYKSKGTEKSFRNMFRCFGVDDELLNLNIYADNTEYLIEDRYQKTTIRKNFLDCSGLQHTGSMLGTVYQNINSDNDHSMGFISGSLDNSGDAMGSGLSKTFIFNARFPRAKEQTDDFYIGLPGNSLSSSIGGFAAYGDEDPNTSSVSAMVSIFAVRQSKFSKKAKFVVEASGSTIETDYVNVYDESDWTIALRFRNQKLMGDRVVEYDEDGGLLELAAIKVESGEVSDVFTGSVQSGDNSFVFKNIRIYCGALLDNLTGSVQHASDLKFSGVQVWHDELSLDELRLNAINPHSFGRLGTYENAYMLKTNIQENIPKTKTLQLYWNFENISSSDSSGEFFVDDISSGSINSGTLGYPRQELESFYSGKGFNFPNNTTVVDKSYFFTSRKSGLENLANSEMINVLGDNDRVFTRETKPIKHFFSIEISMYKIISDEILNMFSSMADFSNLIGNPINRYRPEYKDLSKLRQMFFERVSNTPDLDKFTNYYKWIDSSITEMIKGLFPASAASSNDIRTVVESHILERNKVFNKLPTIEFKKETLEGQIESSGELEINWKYGHHPITNEEADNVEYWQSKAERVEFPLSSSDAGVNHSRQLIFNANVSALNRRRAAPLRLTVEADKQPQKEKIEIKQQTVIKNIRELPDINDRSDLSIKKYHEFEIEQNNDSFDGKFSFLKIKEDYLSGSFEESVKRTLIGHHYDGRDGNLQGQFTKAHVGGKQHRHVEPFASPSGEERPEGFDIDFSEENKLTLKPIFAKDPNRARFDFYREERTFRPVNIKNIQSSTGSNILGNFIHNYEVIHANGRSSNNLYFRDSEGIDISGSGSSVFGDLVEFTLPDRNSNKSIFVNRFSAPGDETTLSRGMLDTAAEEYSTHNALPYRNLDVRIPLNKWYAKHSGQFGYDSEFDAPSASYHKTNRNSTQRIEYSGSSFVTASVYDNWFVSRAIPARQDGYSWITASMSHIDASGTIEFMTASEFISAYPDIYTPELKFGIDYRIKATGTDFMHTSFAWLNTNVIQPSSVPTNILGYHSFFSVEKFLNTTGSIVEEYVLDGIPSTLNAILLQRGSIYGWPTWKQIRGFEHPITRKLINSNTFTTDLLTISRYPFYEEPCVIMNNKPVVQIIELNGDSQIVVKHTHDNDKQYFANEDLNFELGIVYSSQDPLLSIENKLLYSHTIFPRKTNTNLNRSRSRTEFTFDDWRNSREDRNTEEFTNSLGYVVTASSIWPLDSLTGSTVSADRFKSGGELMGYDGHNSGDTAFFPYSASLRYRRYNTEDRPQWTAHESASVNPYYGTYGDWQKDLRTMAQGHSIVPEFRISEHIDTILTSGSSADIDSIFSLTGTEQADSSNDDFGNYYMVSDLMPSFREISSAKGNAKSMKINCSAFLKLNPYNGFYPVQRTIELGSMFIESIDSYVSVFGGDATKKSIQTAIKPFYAPGIMYNTIKSGIAVDYLVATDEFIESGKGMSMTGSYIRLPFESIKNPYSYLSGLSVIDTETDSEFLLDSTASFGDGIVEDVRYINATSNFFDEIQKFFLKNKTTTEFVSRPQSEFGLFIADQTYSMKIMLNKTDDFCMYADKSVTKWNGFGPYRIDSSAYISPYAPPYTQHGSSGSSIKHPTYKCVQIDFTPSTSGRFTIGEIVSQCTSSFLVNGDEDFSNISGASDFVMKITASVDIFDVTQISKSKEDDPSWRIKVKCETPMLNYPHLIANRSVNDGIWHGYGQLPSDSEGVFLSVQNVRDSESLANAIGMPTRSKKIGEIADSTSLKEAVILVPFRYSGNGEKLFYEGRNKEFDTILNNYVLPPKFDYIKNNVEPIKMFGIEFGTELNKEDLSKIWQNLMPSKAELIEHKNMSINIPLSELNLTHDTQWMIFKVKQKSANLKEDYGYNWPYDYCSLVEMIKIDAEVEF